MFARVGLSGLRLAAIAPEPSTLIDAAKAPAASSLIKAAGRSPLTGADPAFGKSTLTEADMAAARWTMDKGVPAGKGTDTLSGVPWFFIPLRTARLFSGVLAISRDAELSPAERRRMDAMADQGASALERAHIARAFEEVRVEMDAEKIARPCWRRCHTI